MRTKTRRARGIWLATLAVLACTPSFSASFKKPPRGMTVIPVTSGSSSIVLNGASNVLIRGVPPMAVLRGGGTNGIDIRNCTNIRVENVTATGFFRGTFIQNSNNVELVNVTATRNQKQGFFVHDSRNTTFRQCEGSLTQGEHALYLAETIDGALIEDCHFYGTPMSALQANSEGGSYSRNIVVRRTRVENRYGCYFLGAEFRMEQCQVTGERPILCSNEPGRSSTGVVRNCLINGRVFLQGSQIDLDASNTGIFDIVRY